MPAKFSGDDLYQLKHLSTRCRPGCRRSKDDCINIVRYIPHLIFKHHYGPSQYAQFYFQSTGLSQRTQPCQTANYIISGKEKAFSVTHSRCAPLRLKCASAQAFASARRSSLIYRQPQIFVVGSWLIGGKETRVEGVN